jgi:hypothetical protein
MDLKTNGITHLQERPLDPNLLIKDPIFQGKGGLTKR